MKKKNLYSFTDIPFLKTQWNTDDANPADHRGSLFNITCPREFAQFALSAFYLLWLAFSRKCLLACVTGGCLILQTVAAQETSPQRDWLNFGDRQEIGLHFGNFLISGDVDHQLFPGWGAGLHYRKALNHAFSLRPELFYGITYGLDAAPSSDALLNEQAVFEGYGVDNPWFYSYQTKLLRLSLQGVLELSNLGYNDKLRKWNYYVSAGLGVNSHGTNLDLLDANDQLYSNLLEVTGFNSNNDFNTTGGRKAIRQTLRDLYDGTYETPAFKEEGVFRLGDETNVALDASIGLGISYKLSRDFNLSLDHQLIFTTNDYLDGKRWRSASDQTRGADLMHYTSLRLAINIGPKGTREPLYWLDPWRATKEQVDSLGRLVGSYEDRFADDDKDGVLNIVDRQQKSKNNCDVNTKGITLDSDSDGLPDCDDPYPFINKNVLEQMIGRYLRDNKAGGTSDATARRELEQKVQVLEAELQEARSRAATLSFPLIFFDSGSDALDMEGYKALANVAVLVKEQGIPCLQVTGHADSRDSEEFNEALGLKRANQVIQVLQEDFGLQNLDVKARSEGERQHLIEKPANLVHWAVNRRVEIEVCN